MLVELIEEQCFKKQIFVIRKMDKIIQNKFDSGILYF